MCDLVQSARYTLCGIGRLVGLRGISRVRNPPFPEQHGPVTVPLSMSSESYRVAPMAYLSADDIATNQLYTITEAYVRNLKHHQTPRSERCG